MQKRSWRKILLVLAWMVIVAGLVRPAIAGAQNETGQTIESEFAGQTLTIATKPLEPFVFVDDGPLRGFSIDYWDEIARRLGVSTEYVEYETVAEIIDAVQVEGTDASIAGISITTDREAVVDFSQPYYNSGLQIATSGSGDTGTFAALLSLIGSGTFLVPLLILIVLIIVVSHLVWFFERGHESDDFPPDYRSGIGEAIWWSTVSVITGGEAVKNINKGLSRVIAIFWMLIGLFLLAFVTARATSVLTVAELQSDISTIEDLAGKNVGTVEQTASVDFLSTEAGVIAREYPTLDEAIAALDNGDLDAVLFDAPVLSYAVNQTQGTDAVLVEPIIGRDPYGIALPQGSPLLEPLNKAVIEVGRDGTLDALLEEWFG